MTLHPSEREQAVEHINGICLRLFDSWCETRSVTPLVYLMHCWPLLDSGTTSIKRLVETLTELKKFHPETLDHGLSPCFAELVDRANEVLVYLPERTRRAANA
ncbi:hypothetical protein FAZ95_34675 [Trinickia violacea]|uniref:Uncharacterized protein n=1 Tax=Trinickia violacea TaxID=2571746 RepID=A0A4V1EIK9_9BURK|nr:hypothetical protein [Trinickia violacea]QCP54130.1 hypothetical protein FAZ95_34675 [Trinickia violacea]